MRLARALAAVVLTVDVIKLPVRCHRSEPHGLVKARVRSARVSACVALAALLCLAPLVSSVDAATTTTITTVLADSFIDSSATTTNWGTLTQLYVKSCFSGSACNRRALVKLDVSTIPSDAAIKSANLEMLMTTAPGISRTYQAYQILSASTWSEGTGGNFVSWLYRLTGNVAWTTAGGDYTGTPASTITGTTSWVWLTWNIQAMVQAWVDLSATNNGTLIRDSAEGNASIWTGVFVSRQDATASNRPKLTVSYLRKVTSLTAMADTNEVDLTWTNPTPSTDYTGTLIIRKTGSAPTWTPSDGTIYNAGYSPDGGTTEVVLNDTSLATAFSDTGLPNGPTYYYQAFAQDSSNQYSLVSATVNATPSVIVQRNSTSAVRTSANNTCVMTLGATPVPGNVNVVTVSIPTTTKTVWKVEDGASTYTPIQATNNTVRVEVWAATVAPGATTTVTVTLNASATARMVCAVSAYSGVIAFGNVASGTLTGTGTAGAVNVVTQDKNNWVVAGFASAINANVVAVAGTNLRQWGKTTAISGALTDKSSANPATVTSQVTLGSGAWAAAGVELRTSTCAAVADASYVAASTRTGTTEATVYWSSANPVLILRKTSAFGAADFPANNVAYTAGDTINYSNAVTIVYSGTVAESSFTDTGLVAGTTYYYEVIAKTGTPCHAPGVGANLKVEASGPAWSYTLSGGSMLKPGIAGNGSLYLGSNGSRMVTLDTATGLHAWSPKSTSGPVQSWLSWVPTGWQYRKAITIDRNKVSAALTDFPVLISITNPDPDLRDKAQSTGNDILFTSSDGATKLNHQIESYDSSTGKLTAWVRVPSLSSTTDTVLYMYYGNASAASQQSAANVWDANFKGVWHLSQNPAGSAPQMTDTTSSPVSGTTSGGMTVGQQVPGQIGGSLNFDGVNDDVALGNPTPAKLQVTGAITVEAWISPNVSLASLAQWARVVQDWSGTSGGGYGLFFDDTRTLIGLSHSNGTTQDNVWACVDPSCGAAVPFTVGNWYHVVATWSPNPGSKIVYINGLPRTTQASVNASIKAQTTWRMAFGNNDVGGCFGCFNGKIDEVRISNVARSAAWIATSYNNQSSPSTFHSLAAEEATGGTIIGGDQSGRVYSIDEVTGTTNWTADLTAKASSIQASVSVQLAQYASSAFRTKYGTDVLFAVSRNSATLNCGTATTNNKVFALKVTDGTSAGWTFNDTCANSMDYASGMPFVDYARDRLYVTTGNTSGPSLWILDTLNASNSASGTLVGSLALGPIDSSPSLSYDNNTVWVGSGNGFLYGIDAETLTQKWSFNLQTTVKGFVWEDYTTANRIYFTTADGYVWCLQDNGSSASPCAGWGGWPVYARTPVAGASTILLMDYIFVGSSDGKVHQLDVSTGADGTPFPAASTLDGTQVGDVSTETGGEIFVGTSGGHIFKINLVGGALP